MSRHRRNRPLSLAPLALLSLALCSRDARAVERSGGVRCRGGSDRNERLTSGISGAALVGQIERLARLTSDPPPAVTRLLFSSEDASARRYVKGLMAEQGLRVHEDAVGNIFGVWDPDGEGQGEGEEGTTATTATTATATAAATPNAVALPRDLVLSGSHTDAIPLAGAYDGVVGVLGAIAAVGSLRNASLSSRSPSSSSGDGSFSFRPRKPLAAVMFTSEEPTRFGLSCLGSRALAGELGARQLASLRDATGENGAGFFELADAAGVPRAPAPKGDALSRARAALSSARLPSASSFVELHIEQAATLEEKGAPLGVVTAIAAPAALEVSFRGPGGHAGSLPMRLRADAGLAAAAFALDVERIALDASRGRGEESGRSKGGDDSVATVGSVSLSPGAVNSVPREARVSVDVRDVDGARRDRMLRRIREAAAARARERRGENGARVEVEVRTVSEDAPATAGEEVVGAAERAVVEVTGAAREESGEEERKRSLPSRVASFLSRIFSSRPPPLLLLPSRAYHDALFMSRITKQTGMIFVRCRGGWSHRPDEFASEKDVELGVKALALALAELAGGEGGC